MLVGDVIRQFKFVEIDDFRHPLLSSGRTVGVNVHAFWHFGVSFSCHHPARVVELIPAVVRRYDIHQQNIFGLFVQSRASDFKRREHSPTEKKVELYFYISDKLVHEAKICTNPGLDLQKQSFQISAMFLWCVCVCVCK